MGLRTIGDIAAAPIADLTARLGGTIGRHFHCLALAEDPRRVVGRRRAHSLGAERTLERDVSDRAAIELLLRGFAEEIARRLRRKRLLARGVRVKLKTRSFQSRSRQVMLAEPTDLARTLYDVSVGLIDRFDHEEPYRLVGMAAFDLVCQETTQGCLFEPGDRQRRLETALDELKVRFGEAAVLRAEELERRPGHRMGVNLDAIQKPR
jgi:DNA polymerase-4